VAVMQSEVQVAINGATALITARQRVRELAVQVGLSNTDSVIVATVVSELARNIIAYATRGEIILREIRNGHAEGLEVVAVDEGPGIVDVGLALQDGYSTSGGLGLGLPGVRRLMDEFHIWSEPGKGTAVTVRKWRR